MSRSDWHSLSRDDVVHELQTSLTQGLTGTEAQKRLQEYGPNQLAEEQGRSTLAAFIDQFKDPMVLILLAACVLSILLQEYLDGGAILTIVILNAVLGVVQEHKADQALAALKQLTAPRCRVRRDGKVLEIDSRELVPGDIVVMEAGDPVPADLRLTKSAMLQVDESLLTGESLPVNKDAGKNLTPSTPTADKVNMAFMSTAITYGHGEGVVIATGMETEVGHIAGKLQEEGKGNTPLQKRLGQFSQQLGGAMVVICILVGVLGLWRGMKWLDVLLMAISLAVATIPEGLPAVTTIVLAMGTQRMAARNAVIRRLSAVETLGSATVICSDKTGTLTQNRMTVTRLWIPEEGITPGEGQNLMEPRQVHIQTDPVHTQSPAEPAQARGPIQSEHARRLENQAGLLLAAGALCTDASLDTDEAGHFKSLGDPTETALVVAAAQAELDKRRLEEQHPRLAEVPFSSDRKRMTTIHHLDDTHCTGIVKGGPDVVLARCTKLRIGGQAVALTPELRQAAAEANQQMAQEGIRVLAVALTPPFGELPEDLASLEHDLELVGLIGMTDPPRPESATAVAEAQRAGIRTIMITGDHSDTALAIAKKIGIAGAASRALTGPELETMNQEQLDQAVNEVSVYARVSPEHKLRIVDALRRQGQVVAMTGDGVNDAPALKRADIGIAMGLVGTGVARGAADMVLMDDNFATIVNAVEEGRTIYGNIQKAAFFLLSANLAELGIMVVALLLGMSVPLEPIQLLWINLITDSLPAIALGMEPVEPGIMDRSPRNPREPVLTSRLIKLMLIQAALLTSAVLVALNMGIRADPANAQVMGSTYAFAVLTLAQLWWAHGCRSDSKASWQVGFFRNRMAWVATAVGALLLIAVITVPFLEPIFQVRDVSAQGWLWILVLSLLPSLIMEFVKKLLPPAAKG